VWTGSCKSREDFDFFAGQEWARHALFEPDRCAFFTEPLAGPEVQTIIQCLGGKVFTKTFANERNESVKSSLSFTEATLSICLVARYRGLEPVFQKIHRKTKKERDIMSKSTSLKGYAVGALVALVSSLFMVAPAAQADANGPVTLLPTAGTTFNTIIGSPITLVSVQDASTRTEASAVLAASNSYYIVNNPAEAEIEIVLGQAPGATFSYLTYNADGTYLADKPGNSTNLVVNGQSIKTSMSKIAIGAAITSTGVLNTLSFDATDNTATVTLTVQTLVDTNKGTGKGKANGFDRVSNVETVVLYSPASVTATTSIDRLAVGATSTKISVVYGNSVNPFFVAAQTAVSIYKGGTIVAVSQSNAAVSAANRIQGYVTSAIDTSISAGVITAGYLEANGTTELNLLTGMPAMATFTAAVYSAQAFYNTTGNVFVTVGAGSSVANLAAGAVNLAAVTVSHTATLDTLYAQGTSVTARTGTKAVTLNAQIQTGSAAMLAANAELKAVLTENTLAAASSVAITGAVTALVDGGSAVTAYARTDADGKASFTITSNNGTKADSVNVRIYAKNLLGAWVAEDATGTNIVWANAAFASFKASPADYASGANPTVTFKAKDQFGGPVNVTDVTAKPLSVYVVASFGGVADATKYSATANVVDGAATFTFANFAPAGGLAQLQAQLFAGGVGTGASTAVDSEIVNVYNTALSSEIAVVTSFETPITYVDYVTGDTATPAVAAAVAAAGLGSADGTLISGTVLNTLGVGQPGIAVTVAADGVLFLADGVYTLDTVTTAANEFGALSVKAFAHTVNAKGATVTITADGLSATTLLVTYLPSSLDDANLDLSWVVPANVVKNTTYAITATLADKWGNPVAATNAVAGSEAISFVGAGSVEVNSIPAGVKRNLDKNGQATVFIRSVKDVAGPGALTATLRTGTGAWTYPTGATGATGGVTTNVGTLNTTNPKSTAWNESLWSNALSVEVEVLDSAADITTDTKVNAGSFKGYVAIYAKGYEGQRLSAKVGKDWVVIPALGSNYERVVELVGPGVDVTVRIYIDRVLVDTISLTTK
jgi:hypothetical protein